MKLLIKAAMVAFVVIACCSCGTTGSSRDGSSVQKPAPKKAKVSKASNKTPWVRIASTAAGVIVGTVVGNEIGDGAGALIGAGLGALGGNSVANKVENGSFQPNFEGFAPSMPTNVGQRGQKILSHKELLAKHALYKDWFESLTPEEQKIYAKDPMARGIHWQNYFTEINKPENRRTTLPLVSPILSILSDMGYYQGEAGT